MDSSPDLSLKLRRGSNDSRDSYYMDFAQGIDSDIEEVATIATAPPGNVEIASTDDSSDSQVAVALPAASDLDNDNEIGNTETPPPPLPPSPPQDYQSSPQQLQSPPLPPSPLQQEQQQELELEEDQEIADLMNQQEGAKDELHHYAEQQEFEQEPEQEELSATPIPSPPPTPPASPPPLYVAPLEPISTIPTMPTIVPSMERETLATSANAIASLTDTSTTDEEDLSQITPLPMPILPPLKTDLLQMLPTNPLVLDDDER